MVDLQELINQLTEQDIIDIMETLGADRYQDKDNEIIFPTICHNEASEDASMKLYYYKDSKIFHCYTDCSSSFNVYTLIEKVWTTRGYNKVKNHQEKKNKNDFCFFDIVQFLLDYTNGISSVEKDLVKYKSEKNRYKVKKRLIDLPVYSDKILDSFECAPTVEWLEEGISVEAMKYYNIRYSISRNKIIIPHYNINGELVGIRGRALNTEEVEKFGKYMPLEVEGQWYSHQLSQNLYGLNLVKDNIRRLKKVVLFEGEKSPLKYYDAFGENNNIAVAVCGSALNKAQINLLMKNFDLDEIIVAFDKENYDRESDEKYFNKLYNLCQKYNNYVNFSFIYDRKGLLDLKDSPIDKGIEIYKKLYEGRVRVK